MRARIIYNPTAGRELLSKRMVEILELLEAAGYETSCKATEGKNSAVYEASKAAESGFDLVVAAGGDGTINEVINGLAIHNNPPKLAILPGGTTNDFARALKIPRNFAKACEIIQKGKSKFIDIGLCDKRYFMNVAAVGHLTEVSGVPSSLKTMIGPFAYYMKIVEKLGKILKPFPARIVTDKGIFEDDVILLIISNTVSVGGFSKLTPHASVNDGLLDVLILPKMGIPQMLHVAAAATKGEHIKDPKVTYVQSAHIEATIPDTLHFNLDGEWSDISSCSIKVVPRKLQVFCP